MSSLAGPRHVVGIMMGCVAWAGVMGTIVLLHACGGQRIKAGASDSPTGGLALRVNVSDGRSSHALYIVEPDGTIAFGGGYDAMQGITAWQGEMSAAEIETLRSLLDANDWLTEPPPGEAEGEAPRLYQVQIALPGVRAQWDVRGEHPRVRPVVAFLEQVSSRRNQAVFDQLPEADPPR